MIALRAFSLLSRLAQGLVVLFAMSLFAWVTAHWTWRALEPAATPRAAPQADSDWSARILSGSAMGYTRVDPVPQAAASAVAAIDSRIRLLGLAREPGARGKKESQALFKIDKRILWLRPGEELDPGITLAAIDGEGVRLSAGGRDVRLPLRGPARAAGAGAPSVAASAPAQAARTNAPGDSCKLAPEQRTRAYVLRPEIVDGVMRERSTWADLFKATANGIVVQNPGGTGAMLGLYGNDVLAKAGGAQLSSADDILRLVLQPLSRNESVVVTGTRAGQPREWIYAGMNCLAR